MRRCGCRSFVVLVRVGQQFRQPAPPSQPRLHRPVVNQVKTSGTRLFVYPSVKMTAAKEHAQKLESALAAMEGMDGPEVDSLRAAHKRAQEAVKGHRVVEEAVGRIEGSVPGSHSGSSHERRRGGSAAVEGDGVPIASTNRRNAFESPSGQSARRASFQEAMSPRRICSSVRRGDGGVVGRTPRRSSEGIGDGTAPRGGKALSINDNRSRRVAPVDSEPEDSPFCVGEYSEVITHQCGLLGVRVGEASHPGPRVRPFWLKHSVDYFALCSGFLFCSWFTTSWVHGRRVGVLLQIVVFSSFVDRAHQQSHGPGWGPACQPPNQSQCSVFLKVDRARLRESTPTKRATVTRLEKALEAMGDVQGPAVEVLKSELTKPERHEATSVECRDRSVSEVHQWIASTLCARSCGTTARFR